MREIYSAPTKMKQLAGFAGSLFLSTAVVLSGVKPFEPTEKQQVRDFYPESAWGQCDPSLWEHVHGADLDGVPGPDRLEIIDPCRMVSGKIIEIQKQADGDLHVLLRPDPNQFDITLDSRFKENINNQQSSLVTEPICTIPVEDEKVKKEGVCNKFFQRFNLRIGRYVRMIGSMVSDKNHGNHLEIHPITSIKVTS